MAYVDALVGGTGLHLRVQPIVSFGGNVSKVIAVEALTSGPAGTNFASASILFAYARRMRAEQALDRTCFALAMRMTERLPRHLRVSVNLHASTIAGGTDFAGFVESAAARHGFDPKRLIVEIVEHAHSWSEARLVRGVEDLRTLGAAIALDDVGLGLSNYKMVLDTAPDFLKIDAYFVTGAAEDPRRRKVLRSIQQLAAEFGALTIAEGIETTSDLSVVERVGILLGQGYLFSRPIDVDALTSIHLDGISVAAARPRLEVSNR